MRRLLEIIAADWRLTKKHISECNKRMKNYRYLRTRKVARMDAWRSAMYVL